MRGVSEEKREERRKFIYKIYCKNKILGGL